VQHWLLEETLPLWSTVGVDDQFGGFHEALGFDARPLMKPKRMRTMARQVYAFAVAKQRGWDGPADALIDHGIRFMADKGRTDTRRLGPHAECQTVQRRWTPLRTHTTIPVCFWRWRMRICRATPKLLRLGDRNIRLPRRSISRTSRMTGFIETSDGEGERRSNPHMHLLEAFLAWYAATGDRAYLRRAARIIDLFRSHFFEVDSWTLGEFFDRRWKPAAGEKGHGPSPATTSNGPRCWSILPTSSGQKPS
jgi:mannose/cellobiose epimerase-like protein (N-acyl-D-glucosamine 2-epimerase family)